MSWQEFNGPALDRPASRRWDSWHRRWPRPAAVGGEGDRVGAVEGFALVGIGGQQEAVIVTTKLELVRQDGAPVAVSGDFATFVDTAAADRSVLVGMSLTTLTVILSWRRKEIHLLAGNHRYAVIS